VKQAAHEPVCVSGFVTDTLTAPAACAVVTPVMVVALSVATVSGAPPNDTVALVWKPVPEIVTEFPPAVEPLFGVTELTVGGGAALYV
jgi:hypothetical protein